MLNLQQHWLCLATPLERFYQLLTMFHITSLPQCVEQKETKHGPRGGCDCLLTKSRRVVRMQTCATMVKNRSAEIPGKVKLPMAGIAAPIRVPAVPSRLVV